MKSEHIKLIPLGGLGEIGMNMMLLQYQDKGILIDAGVMFPDPYLPGIDLILPPIDYLLSSQVKIQAVLLTHGHEDHIGALPFLLRHKNLPIYGSAFSMRLVERRLLEHGLNSVPMHVVKAGDHRELGPFAVEWISVSHSIAQALALAIRTPLGTIVHSGDFKIDAAPADGSKTDMDRFAALGAEGVLLLLSDSTNVEVPGRTISESTVYDGLLDLAQQSLGQLDVPKQLMVSEQEAMFLPRHKLIVACTGSQGEPRSILSRFAHRELKGLELMLGDEVVLSSRFIPGNEKAIYKVINGLYRCGAQVHTQRGSDVHVSGHGFREDLRMMLQAVKPKFFIPIHGEYRHLILHQELARECGVEHVLHVEDQQEVRIFKDRAEVSDRLELNNNLVMEQDMSALTQHLLSERRKLSYAGCVVVVARVERTSKRLRSGVDVYTRGVFFDDDLWMEEDLEAFVEQEYQAKWGGDDAQAFEIVMRAARKYVSQNVGRKPVVIPVILEV